MTSLNTTHACYLLILAILVGSFALFIWRRIVWLRRKDVSSAKPAPTSILSKLILGYACASFAVATTLLLLMIIECIGMGNSIGPIVEALSKLETKLAA